MEINPIQTKLMIFYHGKRQKTSLVTQDQMKSIQMKRQKTSLVTQDQMKSIQMVFAAKA